MTRRRWIGGVATMAVAAALVLPVADAAAHPGTWHWSQISAAAVLEDEGIEWEEIGFHTVVGALCRGYGTYLRSRTGARLFKHFLCYVEAEEDDPYYVSLHVLGRTTWSADFIEYAE